MSWLSRLKGAAAGSRAARKTFDKAIERVRAELAKRRNDPRLRSELADVLIEAGRGKEAVGLLEGLADEYALAGWSARAIVVLKKIQRIEPREAVAEKLACLIAQQREPAPDPWRFAQSPPASGGALE